MIDSTAGVARTVPAGDWSRSEAPQHQTTRFRRALIQCRDVFRMKAHCGWIHFLLQRGGNVFRPVARLAQAVYARLGRQSDLRSEAFDRIHGTDTFTRRWVKLRGAAGPEATWGYSPINQDFFREIMRSVPICYRNFDFVDLGCGKGAALMLASEFGFKRICGIDISAELLSIARTNAEKYRQATGRAFLPDLVHTDVLDWTMPTQDTLYFLNNPFPPDISLRALLRLEEAVQEKPGRVLLVYRKAPMNVAGHLNNSPRWRPIRLAPYWRIYSSLPPARR